MLAKLLVQSGLTSKTIALINSVFAQHPNVQAVYIYGSRAKGDFRIGSDIDLTIKGSILSFDELLCIETALDDLMIPYSIDLSIFENIGNPNLIAHINRIALLFYKKENDA